ncbi:MAG: hypothetical protein ACUVTL_01880 [Thermoproteota archaeon]
MKMKQLPIWEFINQVEGKASEIVKFKNDDVFVAYLGGKEVPIESFDYDYLQSRGISGTVYVEFKIKDLSGKTERFRLYDNEFGESRFTIEMGDHFRPVEGFEENSEYKQGVAVGIYINKDTGYFELIYKIVTPETKDKVFDWI